MESCNTESSLDLPLESLSLQPFLQSLHKEQWQEVRLGEVAEITSSKRIFYSEYVEYGIPFYRSKEIIEFSKGNNPQNELFIDENKYNDIANKFGVPQANDILLTSVGTLGIPYLVPKDKKFYFKDGNLTWFKNFKNITSLFLFYWFKSPQGKEKLDSIAIGSTQQALTIQGMKNLIFLLPPLTIQQKIAEILSSFDDKIDLLHRQNNTLESLALTLFRHYFIDNPKRDEWEEVSLDDICLKIASGGTPSTKIKEYYCGNINWYSTKEFNDNFLFNSVQTITEKGLLNSSAKLFPKDTIVIAIYAAPTVGRLGILTQDSAFNQAACGLIVDEAQCSKEFIFLFLKNERKNLNLLASGSAQQNLNVEKIKNYTLALPDKNSLYCFNIQAKGFFDKIYNNTKQIQNLQAMRDMLLKAIFA